MCKQEKIYKFSRFVCFVYFLDKDKREYAASSSENCMYN